MACACVRVVIYNVLTNYPSHCNVIRIAGTLCRRGANVGLDQVTVQIVSCTAFSLYRSFSLELGSAGPASVFGTRRALCHGTVIIQSSPDLHPGNLAVCASLAPRLHLLIWPRVRLLHLGCMCTSRSVDVGSGSSESGPPRSFSHCE